MATSAELHVIETDDELAALVEASLAKAGTTLDDLRDQAHTGRFRSEKLRRTWFTVSSLLNE